MIIQAGLIWTFWKAQKDHQNLQDCQNMPNDACMLNKNPLSAFSPRVIEI